MFTVKTGQTGPGKLLVVAIVVLVAVMAALPAGATGDDGGVQVTERDGVRYYESSVVKDLGSGSGLTRQSTRCRLAEGIRCETGEHCLDEDTSHLVGLDEFSGDRLERVALVIAGRPSVRVSALERCGTLPPSYFGVSEDPDNALRPRIRVRDVAPVTQTRGGLSL